MYKLFIFLVPTQSAPNPPSKSSIIQNFRPQALIPNGVRLFFYFNYLNTDFSEIVRKQFTVAKFANHNFIIVYINNSIGVIIPILVKKAN